MYQGQEAVAAVGIGWGGEAEQWCSRHQARLPLRVAPYSQFQPCLPRNCRREPRVVAAQALPPGVLLCGVGLLNHSPLLVALGRHASGNVQVQVSTSLNFPPPLNFFACLPVFSLWVVQSHGNESRELG